MSQAKDFFGNNDYLDRFEHREEEPKLLNFFGDVDEDYVSHELPALPSVLDENYCRLGHVFTHQRWSNQPVVFQAWIDVFVSPREDYTAKVDYDGTSKGFTEALREYADSFDAELEMWNFKSYEDINIVTGELERFEPKTSVESIVHTIYQICDKLDEMYKTDFTGDDIQRGLELAKDVLKFEYKIPNIEKYESDIDLSAKIVFMRESSDDTLTFNDIYRELKDVYNDVSFGDIEKYAPELTEIATNDDSYEELVSKESASDNSSDLIISDDIRKSEYSGEDIQRGLDIAKDILKYEYKIPSTEKYESNIDLSEKITSMRESPDSLLTFDDIYQDLKDVYRDISAGNVGKYTSELKEIAASEDSHEGIVDKETVSDSASSIIDSAFSTNVPERTTTYFPDDEIKHRFPVISKFIEENGGKMHDLSGETQLANPFGRLDYYISISLPSILAKDSPEIDRNTGFLPLDKGGEPYTIAVWFDGTADGLVEEINKEANDFEPNDAAIEFHFYEYYDSSTDGWEVRTPEDRAELMKSLLDHVSEQLDFVYSPHRLTGENALLGAEIATEVLKYEYNLPTESNTDSPLDKKYEENIELTTKIAYAMEHGKDKVHIDELYKEVKEIYQDVTNGDIEKYIPVLTDIDEMEDKLENDDYADADDDDDFDYDDYDEYEDDYDDYDEYENDYDDFD